MYYCMRQVHYNAGTESNNNIVPCLEHLASAGTETPPDEYHVPKHCHGIKSGVWLQTTRTEN